MKKIVFEVSHGNRCVACVRVHYVRALSPAVCVLLMAGLHSIKVNLVPSLALLLGLPVPASSLGGVWPELFSLPTVQAAAFRRPAAPSPRAATSAGEAASAATRGPRRRVQWSAHPLSQALLVNAAQVWAYLQAYDHASRGLPPGALAPLERQLRLALQRHRRLAAADAKHDQACAHEEELRSTRSSAEAKGEAAGAEAEAAEAEAEAAEAEAEAVWLAYRAFLAAALALGRRLFTRCANAHF